MGGGQPPTGPPGGELWDIQPVASGVGTTNLLQPEPEPEPELEPEPETELDVYCVSVSVRCGLLELCGIEHCLEDGQDAGSMPEGVPQSFKHIVWAQRTSEQCVWAAALARSRICCEVNALQFQTIIPTDAVASSAREWLRVRPNAVVDVAFTCPLLLAPVFSGDSVGQLEITSALQCTKRQDHCARLHLHPGGSIVVSRHGCNSTIRVDLGAITIKEQLVSLCSGDWTAARICQLYNAEPTHPVEVTVSAAQAGFGSPGAVAYQQFLVLPFLRCDLFARSQRLRVSTRPCDIQDSQQSEPLKVSVGLRCVARHAKVSETALRKTGKLSAPADGPLIKNGEQVTVAGFGTGEHAALANVRSDDGRAGWMRHAYLTPSATVDVVVSAALCETIVALLGPTAGLLSIRNDTSLDLQVIQDGGLSGQLEPSGVYTIRSHEATQQFCLQIPGCQRSSMVCVSKGVANHGQPICIPSPDGQRFVRIDVSGTDVIVKPAFTLTSQLPESVWVSLKQRTASGSVNIPPGKTEGIYSCLNGRFPITVEFLRAECHNERRDSYKTRDAFPIQFVDGQEFDVKLIDEASGRITMKLVIAFKTEFEMEIFSRFWVVNRLMLPMKIKASGKWDGECWPSATSPGAAYTVGVGSKPNIRLSLGPTWHEIDIKRKGSGSIPFEGGQVLDYSVDVAPGQFSRTTVLTIGSVDLGLLDELVRYVQDPWSIQADLPSLNLRFADMSSGFLFYWPQFPPQRDALGGDLFSVSICDAFVDTTIGSGEHNTSTVEVRQFRVGGIQVEDLEKRRRAVAVSTIDLSGFVKQQEATETNPRPPQTLSVSVTIGNVVLSIDDTFLLILMAVQNICLKYYSQVKPNNDPAEEYFALLHEQQTPDVQLVVTKLSVSGTDQEIPMRVDFRRTTSCVLPQVRELSMVPLGDYPGRGWSIPAFCIRSFVGNPDGLLQRLAQAAQDDLNSRWFSVLFGQVLPRLDQAIAVVAANALDSVGAGVVAAATTVGAAPTRAVEAGKLARGRRLDDEYQFGDFSYGATVKLAGSVSDAIGAVAGTVGTVAEGVLGSSAAARWLFADASGPLGKSAYRANPLRWNTGTLDAIAAELGRQQARNAQRGVVLRYAEGGRGEREIELRSCPEAIEWIRAYKHRHGK